MDTDARIKELEGENRAMRSAVSVLARIVGLLRDAELRAALAPAALEPIDRAAEQAERALEAVRLGKPDPESNTDVLTDLPQHGALMKALGIAAARATQEGEYLALAMIDVDDFKRVNAAHGHDGGDALLAAVAKRVQGVVRKSESAYRYGGEEFAVVLYGADTDAAARVAERIRMAISGKPFRIANGREVEVTCSVGVASIPADADDANRLVTAVERALFGAKAGGKNRVEKA